MTPEFADPAAAAIPLYPVAKSDLAVWRAAQSGEVQAWMSATGFEATLGDVRLVPGVDGAVQAAVIGMGDAAARARGRFHVARAVTVLPAGIYRLATTTDPAAADEAALGWLMAMYRFDRYKPGKPVAALLQAPPGVDAARLLAIASGEALTRDLINTPANDMGPDELESAFLALAAQFGAVAQVTRGAALDRDFPMIAAVGRASPRAPRLLDLRWGDAGPRLTLVGKGVCFDTGGLDIKPSAGMLQMKKDMGGAATVMGLAQMIMALGLPLRLRLIVPAVDNAISGDAMRPRDILMSRKGLTVEVNNTDAEGRLILADALALADEDAPDWLVSMATLTGAARVALGPDLAPYFTDDEAVAAALEDAARRVADPVWRLPFWDPYDGQIEPGIADLDNAPSWGFAGAITAALFLRRFVEASKGYTHFDIFGWNPVDAPGRPKGGVGMGARAVLAALPRVLGV